MPVFDEASRFWIEVDGRSLPEYATLMRFDPTSNTEICDVYIPAEKNKSFAIGFVVTGVWDPYRVVNVRVDGHHAVSLHLQPFAHGGYTFGRSLGWPLNYSTTQCYTFGEIDTSQNIDSGSSAEKAKRLQSACIEVELYDALPIAYAPPAAAVRPSVAPPVNPDSKVASLVKCQVKPGGYVPEWSLASALALVHRAGARRYLARFHYRPASLLVAQSIMPAPYPQPFAINGNADKRRRSGSVEDEADAAAAGAETARERKKRLKAQLQAIKQELKEEEEEENRPAHVVDLASASFTSISRLARRN